MLSIAKREKNIRGDIRMKNAPIHPLELAAVSERFCRLNKEIYLSNSGLNA
jgi:hypothetical protein